MPVSGSRRRNHATSAPSAKSARREEREFGDRDGESRRVREAREAIRDADVGGRGGRALREVLEHGRSGLGEGRGRFPADRRGGDGHDDRGGRTLRQEDQRRGDEVEPARDPKRHDLAEGGQQERDGESAARDGAERVHAVEEAGPSARAGDADRHAAPHEEGQRRAEERRREHEDRQRDEGGGPRRAARARDRGARAARGGRPARARARTARGRRGGPRSARTGRRCGAGRVAFGARRLAIAAPMPRPPRNAADTTASASADVPTPRPSARNQTTSATSAAVPENQAAKSRRAAMRGEGYRRRAGPARSGSRVRYTGGPGGATAPPTADAHARRRAAARRPLSFRAADGPLFAVLSGLCLRRRAAARQADVLGAFAPVRGGLALRDGWRPCSSPRSSSGPRGRRTACAARTSPGSSARSPSAASSRRSASCTGSRRTRPP